MTYCPGCGWLMVGHVHLPIVRCINERCHEFDRWCAVNEKLAARVAPEKTDASPSCRQPITDATGLDDA